MIEFFRAAIYTKNIPATERALRLAGAVGAVAATLYLAEPWMRWAAGATAVTLVLTGVVGFCPACYFAGRRLKDPTAT